MPTATRHLIESFLAGDMASATAFVAPDAEFHSPIRDYSGAERIGAVWRTVGGVVADARPTSIHEGDGETIAFFAGAIKGRPVDGVMRALADADDRVTDVTLMIRPWAALKAGIADIGGPEE